MLKEIFKIDKDYRNAIIAAALLFAMSPNFINLSFQYVRTFFLVILENENIGSLLQGMGLALLTILIPLAISVLQAFLRFEKRKEKNIEVLVLVDCVLNIKRLILGTFFVFFPSLFWEESLIMFRMIELVFWFMGIIILVDTLYNVYNWIKSSDFQFHFLYLEKIENKEELRKAWNLVWQNRDMDFSDEIRFLKIFSKRINILPKNKKTINLIAVGKLLKGFQNGLENRRIGALFYPNDFLIELLGWHFLTWELKEKYLREGLREKRNIELYTNYSEILRVLDLIVTSITRRVLEEKGRNSFTFFNNLEKHYISYKDKAKYLKDFFNIFCPVFIDKIHKSSENYDIWNHYFPDNWRITKETLENKESCVARVWLAEFLEWARPRIENPKKKKADSELETITRKLFPTIDPILWARFLIFLFTPSYESKIKAVIERDWNFGFIGHIFVGDHTESFKRDFRKREESFKKNTIDFIHYFNDKIIKSFSGDSLREHKIELEGLKGIYKEGFKEERHRLGLLYLITQLIEYKKEV